MCGWEKVCGWEREKVCGRGRRFVGGRRRRRSRHLAGEERHLAEDGARVERQDLDRLRELRRLVDALDLNRDAPLCEVEERARPRALLWTGRRRQGGREKRGLTGARRVGVRRGCRRGEESRGKAVRRGGEALLDHEVARLEALAGGLGHQVLHLVGLGLLRRVRVVRKRLVRRLRALL